MTNIFIIEDDKDIRDALTEVLELEGFAVTSACNGQDGINQLRDISPYPQVILLDLMMPIKDGYQFREEQKTHPSLAHIPVIVMSADNNITLKAARINAAGHLKKPVEIDHLLNAIQQFCN